ncbi:MAG: galactose oxidase [Gemmataceae bacterium]|nr:galactose oxidase [Gemmataceae bacterium]
MNLSKTLLSLVSAAGFLLLPGVSPAQEWKKISPLPDREGFASPFAGVSHGSLLLAGGANFPGKKPWEGGIKSWHDSIFILEKPNGQWKSAGKLARPLAYGISASFNNRVICVGGSNADGHFPEAFSLEWLEGKLFRIDLPSLPIPLANAGGALTGSILHIVGGQEGPDAPGLKNHYQMDLEEKTPKWIVGEPLPGQGRILPLAASFQGKLIIAGGAELRKQNGVWVRRFLDDAFSFTREGWVKIASLPAPAVAPPSPAPANEDGFFLLGGDDGKQVGIAPEKHKGFSSTLWFYAAAKDQWQERGKIPAPRVTVPCVKWNSIWIIPGGEIRPGVRSPEVWGWQFSS